MSEVSPGQLTRQELYDKIRESSKEEYILSEMKRLGFWPDTDEKPSLAEQSIRRQAELQTELRALLKRQRQIEDPERALKEMRKKRLMESREKQEQHRIDKNQQRYEQALAWHEKQKTDISYIGDTVSHGLSDHQSDEDKLVSKGLPVLHSAEQLANSMGISIAELRFLSYSRDVSKVSHYRHFSIRKKSGGERRICAPMPRLKQAQYWVLENILNKLPLHNASHGFVKGRSIVSNALPHIGQAIVINMDLQDFFPTLTYKRVKGLIRSLGYSEQVSTIVGLMLTEPQCDEVELHDQRYFIARGERLLPQGSPASPAVSNLTCRRLDHRLIGMAKKLGFVYTRYADDMTFSAPDQSAAKELNKLLWRARSIVKDEGFIIHPKKTRIMRQGAKQEVTGLVVNTKPSIDRAKVRRFRAAVHCVERRGWDNVTWEGSDNVRDSMLGFANYLVMVDPDKGVAYRDRLMAVGGHSTKRVAPGQYGNRALRANARAGSAPDWWKPDTRKAPVLEKTQQQIKEERRTAKLAAQGDTADQGRASGSGGDDSVNQNGSSSQSENELSNASANQSSNEQAAAPVDPATGRFRPGLGHLFLQFAVILVLTLITKNPLLLFIGATWVALSYFLWRQSALIRVAILLICVPLVALLLSLIF